MKRESGLNELANILRHLVTGLSKKQIREKLNISKTSLANYLRRLEKLGNIKRLGKYEVQVLSSSLNNPRVTTNLIENKLNKRGHAFNFKILFPMETTIKENKQIKSLVEQKKAELLSFGSIRLREGKNTIWFNKGSITIYSNNSYYAENALHTKFKALQDIDFLVRDIKYRFGLKGLYGIEIFREHYGLIFNQFAEWLLGQNRKLEVKNINNKSILWVDDSKKDDVGLKEFEGSNALKINKADEYFKDCDKTNWEVTPSFVLTAIKGVTDNQIMFDKNFQSHLKVIRQLGEAVDRLTKEVTEFKDAKKNN